MASLAFQVDDLDLNQMSVTTMRDGVALPDTGASYTSCCSFEPSSSCCCCCAEIEVQ